MKKVKKSGSKSSKKETVAILSKSFAKAAARAMVDKKKSVLAGISKVPKKKDKRVSAKDVAPKKKKERKPKALKPYTIPLGIRTRIPRGVDITEGDLVVIKDQETGKQHPLLFPQSFGVPGVLEKNLGYVVTLSEAKKYLAKLNKGQVASALEFIVQGARFERQIDRNGTSPYPYRHAIIPGKKPASCTGFAPSSVGLTSDEVLKLAKTYGV